ncbi:hypothetical protein Cni_G09448 [Canna indica]|uniref:ACT domain-containing protein ACR n=1 Tax=Canna indica TaxID=4628 RepID=A0AAQ3Q9M7_9LILI|nr:hypothetical protein Cni_G09448 [Canna indica]
MEDSVGVLSDVTRIPRENGLTIKRAEISTSEGKAVDRFYLSEMSGNDVDAKTIDSIRSELGQTVLKVKQNNLLPTKAPEVVRTVSLLFSNLFRASLFQSFRFMIRSYT